MTNLIKQHRRKIEIKAAQTWEERIAARGTKKQALVAIASAQVVTQAAPPPIHAPHVIFDKSYLKNENNGAVKKVEEQLRHLSYHDHHTAQAA